MRSQGKQRRPLLNLLHERVGCPVVCQVDLRPRFSCRLRPAATQAQVVNPEGVLRFHVMPQLQAGDIDGDLVPGDSRGSRQATGNEAKDGERRD